MLFSVKGILNKCLYLIVGLSLAHHSSANVVGKLSGDLSVNQGNLSYSLGLPTPSGVHSQNPGLSIHYSPQNVSNILGVGFSLQATSVISRCTPTRDIDGYESGIELSENARFCHDGSRLVATDGSDGANGTEYRLFENNNSKYQSVGGSGRTPSTWVLNTADGYEYSFERLGSITDLYATWFLTSKKDIFGNEIRYVYTEGDSPLLREILYSDYRVELKYDDKNVPSYYYQAGTEVVNNKLLDQIILHAPNGDLAYFYDFSYEYVSSPVEFERLSSVTQCFAGTSSSNNESCLKPVEFGYEELPDPTVIVDRIEQDLLMVVRDEFYQPTDGSNLAIEERPSYATGDITGNGFTDFCYYKVGAGIYCAEFNGTQYGEPALWSEDLGYSANEDDFQAYGLLNLIDLDVDGKSDYCVTDDTGVRCGKSNGSSFSTAADWNTDLDKTRAGTVFGYANKDKYIDVCGMTSDDTYACYAGSETGFNNQILSTNDVDFTKDIEWDYLACNVHGTACSMEQNSYEIDYPNVSFVDIDGDFDQDFCWVSDSRSAFVCKSATTNSSNGNVVYGPVQTYLDLSTLLTPAPDLTVLPTTNIENEALKNTAEASSEQARKLSSGWRMTNLNGDGLLDICYADGTDYRCHLNNGSGFNPSYLALDFSSILSGLDDVRTNEKLSMIRFVDRNVDGLADLCVVIAEIEQCAYNQGGNTPLFADLENRLKLYPDIDVDAGESSQWLSFMRKVFGGHRTVFQFETMRSGYGNLIEVADLDNDGFSEFCYRSQFGIVCSPNDNYGSPAVLNSVTDSYGLRSDVYYDNLLAENLYDPAVNVPSGFMEIPPNIRLVSRIVTDTATAEEISGQAYRNSVSYRYRGYILNEEEDLAGFQSVSEIIEDRNVVNSTSFYTDNDLFGRPFESQTYINDVLVKYQINDMRVDNLSDGTRRYILDAKESRQYELDGTLFETSRTENTDLDLYGFPETITFTKSLGNESITKVTNTTFEHDLDYWILGRPDYQSVVHSANGQSETRTVDYIYSNGRMIEEVIQPGAGNELTIKYQNFNALGYPEAVTSEGLSNYEGATQSRQVSKTYDSQGRVLSETNAFNQTVRTEYHPRCGGATSVEDIAGRKTITQYNDYCQMVSTSAPDSNQSSYLYEFVSASEVGPTTRAAGRSVDYFNPVIYKVTETKAQPESLGDYVTTTYYDAQDRVVRSVTSGFSSDSSARTVHAEMIYNQFGHRVAFTEPFYGINGLQETPRWVNFDYDEIGRPKIETKMGPDKNLLTVSYLYEGASTTIAYSDYQKTTTQGIHGEPSVVTENGLTVTYEYSPAGNLRYTRTGTSALETEVRYDTRGFKTYQNDPSMGEWVYQHNAFGELIYQKDAKNQVSKFYYDVLGRQHTRITPEGTSTWTYYSNGNGIGQVQREQGTEATKEWFYESLGLVESEKLSVNGETFITQFVYDDFSRLIETIQPNNVSIHHAYDNIGQLQNVSMKARDFKDIDFEFLAAERDALLTELARLETLQQAALNKAKYHSDKALEYHVQYQNFLSDYNAVNNTIIAINDAALEHQRRADQYISLYQELSNRASEIRAQFGSSARYKKEDETADNYIYSRTYCVSKHGWGPTRYCAKYQTDTVTVPKNELVFTDATGTVQQIEAPDVINPVTFFTSLANQYHAHYGAQLEIVANINGHDTVPAIADQTVTELDRQTFVLMYELIDKEAQLQLNVLRLLGYQLSTSYCARSAFSDQFRGQKGAAAKIDEAVAACSDATRVVSEALEASRAQRDVEKQTMRLFQQQANSTDPNAEQLNQIMDNVIQYIEAKSELTALNLQGVLRQTNIAGIDYFSSISSAYSYRWLDTASEVQNRIANVTQELNLLRSQIISFSSTSSFIFSEEQVLDLIDHIIEKNGEKATFEFINSSVNHMVALVDGSHPRDYEYEKDRIAEFSPLVAQYVPSSAIELESTKVQLDILEIGTVNENRHLIPFEVTRYEERMVPVMVGDITIFIPTMVEVVDVEYREVTSNEALDYYNAQYQHYFALMEQEIALAAQEIDSLEIDNINSDLAAVESSLALVEEKLQVVDYENLDGLIQSRQQLENSNGRLTLWHAAKRTAQGHLQTEIFGNGLYTHRTLAEETGLVEEITTGVAGGDAIRSLFYEYDDRGRIISKVDTNDTGDETSETFFYGDDQGRLSDWSFDQTIIAETDSRHYSLAHSYTHDELGNITAKTDAGTMDYDPVTNRLEYRYQGGTTYSYHYDNNGNMLTGDGRSYVWRSFNKARSITANGTTVQFKYDAGYRRVMKTAGNEKRYYVNPGYERVERTSSNGTEVIHRYTVWNDNDAVAVLEKKELVGQTVEEQAGEADSISYIHRDILGSGELITDARMQVISRRYYSPFGREIAELIEDQVQTQGGALPEASIFASDNGDIGAAVWSEFDQADAADELLSRYIAGGQLTDLSGIRGYTSHETIEEIGLINMNARLYDPIIGRFTSADSMIPDIETPLDYNRYSYVRGNPVINRDPTGHYVQAVAIAAAFTGYAIANYGESQFWRSAAGAAVSLVTLNPEFAFLGSGSGFWISAARAGVTSLAQSYIATGKIGRKNLQNAALAAASAGAAQSLGPKGALNNLIANEIVGKPLTWGQVTALHMITQGVIADLQGDVFIRGAASALVSKVGSGLTKGISSDFYSSIIVGAMGGLTAKAAGGDFLQGALIAATVHLLNDRQSEPRSDTKRQGRFDNDGTGEPRDGQSRLIPGRRSYIEYTETGGTYGTASILFGQIGEYLGQSIPNKVVSITAEKLLGEIGSDVGEILDVTEQTVEYVTYEVWIREIYDLSPGYTTNENGSLIQETRGRWIEHGDPIKIRELSRQPSHVLYE